MTHPDAAALLEGTTPGPWVSSYKSYFDAVVIHTQGERVEGEVKTLWIARALEGHPLLSPAINANAALIAAAPDLAARVIELEAENARLREIVKRYGDKIAMANAPAHLQETIDEIIGEPTP